MDDSSLRAKSLSDAVGEVQALAAVATDSQMRSLAQLLARCTLSLSDGMAELAGVGFTAKRQLVDRLDTLGTQLQSLERAMTKASADASAQTQTLLTWNKRLVVITGIYTFLTFLIVVASFLTRK